MVEQWSPKPKVKGSNPFLLKKMYVLVAQWIECRTTDSEVESSNLSEHAIGPIAQLVRVYA